MRRPATVDLILAATVLIWAFNVTVTRYVLTHGFQPLAYGALRYAAAALLAVSVTLFLERSLSVGGRRSLFLIALAAGFLLINQVSFVYALKLSSATTVALIMGTTPIFTAIVASLVGLERLTPQFWIATAVGFAGVALVALGSGGGISSDLGGVLLALALSASWGCYSVLIAPLMRRYSPYRISAVVLCVMCVPFVAGRVYVADGNAYFNRPGPRLCESLAILAEAIHPELFPAEFAGTGWVRYELLAGVPAVK